MRMTSAVLLIHLREFIRNDDNEGAADKENAPLLCEAGDSVAHTIRNKGLLHQRLMQFVPLLAGPNRDIGAVPYPLFDLEKIVVALRTVLTDASVLYVENDIEKIFERECLDLKICLISLLNGMVFRIEYPTIRDDFFFFSNPTQSCVHIRIEMDIPFFHELRLNAALPYEVGKLMACILKCAVPEMTKIEAAMHRTHSADGYCEPIKALRRGDILTLSAVPTGASSTQLFDVRRSFAYDTNPIPKSAGIATDFVIPPDPFSPGQWVDHSLGK